MYTKYVQNTKNYLEKPVRVASPKRINLEEPVRVASPKRIKLFLCLSFRLSVRVKRVEEKSVIRTKLAFPPQQKRVE